VSIFVYMSNLPNRSRRGGDVEMKGISIASVVVAAIACAASAMPVGALTRPQSAAVAAKANADALARAKAQAAAKARADAAVKARADAAVKSKASAVVRQSVHAETTRRTQAAQKAAQYQAQIKTANIQLQSKTGGPQPARTKTQGLNKPQVRQAQAPGGVLHPQYVQPPRPHPSAGKSATPTGKSSGHVR
jgi:hypothetical protein